MKSILTAMSVVAALLLSACGGAQAPGGPTDQAPPPPIAERSEARTVLAVPHLTQETLLCVPTSAAMILAFYGDPHPPRELKVMASGGRYDPAAPFDDFSITLYPNLVKAVGVLGYSWQDRSYPDTKKGFADGLRQIVSQVRNGDPVMVDVSAPEGHTMVVSGYDQEAQRVLVVDPANADPGYRWISYAELESLWNEHAFGGKFRALVTTQPR